MNRQEFIAQLEYLLSDLSESDRLDAIAYYNDYFDDAGIENEERVIAELGSPGRVAAIIKADLDSSANDWAEYTENGYEDARMSQNENPLARRDAGDHSQRGKVKIPLVLVIILLIFASPLIFGLGGGLIGLIMGIFGALIGIIAAAVAGCIAGVFGGIGGLIYGIIKVAVSPALGLLYIGAGTLSLSVGIFLVVLILWCVIKWIPALIQVCVNLFQKIFRKVERRS